MDEQTKALEAVRKAFNTDIPVMTLREAVVTAVERHEKKSTDGAAAGFLGSGKAPESPKRVVDPSLEGGTKTLSDNFGK